MSGQLNLLAPPSEEPIVVPICRSVLHAGSTASVEGSLDQPLLPHRHVPPRPPKLPDERAWLAALDFAEEQLRFKYAGVAVLDLDRCSGSGCCGGRCGPSMPMLMSSSRGVEVDGSLATWPQLLKGRKEQREVEFEIARARDLASAYHCLDYYGRVYGEPDEDFEPRRPGLLAGPADPPARHRSDRARRRPPLTPRPYRLHAAGDRRGGGMRAAPRLSKLRIAPDGCRWAATPAQPALSDQWPSIASTRPSRRMK